MPVTPYFGHEKNVKAVKNHLPGVLLFLGPDSVGKWELAEHIRQVWKFKKADVLRVKRLTQDNARFISKFAFQRPQGRMKLVIVRIDEKASKGAQNALLKALEDSSDTVFIIVAEEMPLATIRSRATLYPFGLLTVEDVANILMVRMNFGRDRAWALANASGGQISKALSHVQDAESKLVVLKALDAVHRKDLKELEGIAAKWQQEHTELLVRWCYETITGKWKLFSKTETSITGSKIPLRILVAITEQLRPRLVVRAALASVLQEG